NPVVLSLSGGSGGRSGSTVVGSPASRITVRHSSYVPSVPGQCDCHVTPVAQWLPCAATSAVLSVAADRRPNRSGVNAGGSTSKRLFATGTHLLPLGPLDTPPV